MRLAQGLAATLAIAIAGSAPGQQSEAMITPNYKDADLGQVVEAVSQVTGRSFILDPRVRAQVTMLSTTPMTPDAFYEAFLAILQVHGFIAVPAGNVVKILPDAKVYTLFARKTDDALATTLSREKMANALEQSKNSLLALFVNPAVCAAMTELLKLNANAADCAVARMLISARADALLTAYDTRRAYLQTQLTAYHAKYGP